MLDPKSNLPKNHYKLPYHSKTNTHYPHHDTMNFGFRASQTAQNYANYKAGDAVLKARKGNDHEADNTDVESSPTWRAREIEKGRTELMEKVKSMSESFYELSLKDIVEKPLEHQGSPKKEQEYPQESVSSGTKRQGSSGSFKRRSDVRPPMMMRKGSIGSGGLLIKMVFPVPLGSSSPSRLSLSTSSSPKVSPRPSYSYESEKDWYRNAFSPSGKNGKSFLGGNVGNTKSSRSNKDKIGARQGNGCCWPFFGTKRSKLKG